MEVQEVPTVHSLVYVWLTEYYPHITALHALYRYSSQIALSNLGSIAHRPLCLASSLHPTHRSSLISQCILFPHAELYAYTLYGSQA